LRNLFRLETDKIDPPMIAKIIMSWIQDDIGRYSIGNTFEVENYVNVYGVDDYKSIVPTVEPYDSIHKHPNDPTMWQYVESKSRNVVSNMYSEFCFQQLPRLLRELRASPPSRRAAIYYPLLDPNTCVVYALFKTRWNSTCNVVNCTCHVRSNDSQRGFYFDLAWHSYLLRTLSSMLGMKPGTIRWVVDSFHEYVTHSSFLSNSVEQVDDGLEQKIVRNLSDAPSEYAKLDPRDV
jgi:hypothetical protein